MTHVIPHTGKVSELKSFKSPAAGTGHGPITTSLALKCRSPRSNAFREIYGLELDDVFNASIASYRKSVSKTIPKATKVAWEIKKDEIVQNLPDATAESFVFNYRKPGFGTKLLAGLIRIVPKIGPLKAMAFHSPTPQTEKLFRQSFSATIDRYRQLLAAQQAGRLDSRRKFRPRGAAKSWRLQGGGRRLCQTGRALREA